MVEYNFDIIKQEPQIVGALSRVVSLIILAEQKSDLANKAIQKGIIGQFTLSEIRLLFQEIINVHALIKQEFKLIGEFKTNMALLREIESLQLEKLNEERPSLENITGSLELNLLLNQDFAQWKSLFERAIRDGESDKWFSENELKNLTKLLNTPLLESDKYKEKSIKMLEEIIVNDLRRIEGYRSLAELSKELKVLNEELGYFKNLEKTGKLGSSQLEHIRIKSRETEKKFTAFLSAFEGKQILIHEIEAYTFALTIKLVKRIYDIKTKVVKEFIEHILKMRNADKEYFVKFCIAKGFSDPVEYMRSIDNDLGYYLKQILSRMLQEEKQVLKIAEKSIRRAA